MITIKLGDITHEAVDGIVNAANSRLLGGGGVDGAIHRAAGPSVLEECRVIGECPPGEVAVTGAGKLSAQKVLHAVGPIWQGGESDEANLLRSCYRRCFELASEYALDSLAFPAISTGVYGYPKKEACEIALTTGIEFESKFWEIRYLCFSPEDLEIYRQTFERLSPSS